MNESHFIASMTFSKRVCLFVCFTKSLLKQAETSVIVPGVFFWE